MPRTEILRPDTDASSTAEHALSTAEHDRGDGAPTAVVSTAPSYDPEWATRNAARSGMRLLEVIGKGGMGVVHRGEQLELGRVVAFKQLRDGAHRGRFLREARITAQLDHPHIVPIYFLEETGSAVGYAMKLIEGRTMRSLLDEAAALAERHERPDEEHSRTRLLEHFVKIGEAIAYAHARGVIHRDLKPANFMIGSFGEVYVVDWGIARVLGSPSELDELDERLASDADASSTRTGDILGSPGYMAPEQARGMNDVVDERADQYALGLTLFEIVSLRKAMPTESQVESLVRAAEGTKAPLEHRSSKERIPPELRAIVERATAIEPGARYGSVSELCDDVRRYLRGEAVRALPEGPPSRALRWALRHRRITLAALVAVLAISALSMTWTLYARARDELVAERRGELLRVLYGEVAAQAHVIDVDFRRMEEALEGLRTAAEWALVGPEISGSPRVYSTADFADPARRPADFSAETDYRWPVSVDAPVAALSPGTRWESVAAKVRRLGPLAKHIQSMIVSAGGADPWTMTDAARRAYLRSRKSPIDYAYVDLAEGVHYVYPGLDALPPDYDVRTSSFYTMSANKHGRRWGSPYVDSTTDEQGDDLVLPCTQGLWSPMGDFLGVAGVEITVTKLVETRLALPGRAAVRASLLDEQGRKVVDSRDAGRRFRSSGKDIGIALEPFDLPEVAASVREGREGLVQAKRDGEKVVVAFSRIPALGWTYVVEVPADGLGLQ